MTTKLAKYERVPLNSILDNELELFKNINKHGIKFIAYCYDNMANYPNHADYCNIISAYLNTYITSPLFENGMEELCDYLLSDDLNKNLLGSISAYNYDDLNIILLQKLTSNNAIKLLDLFIECPALMDEFDFETTNTERYRTHFHNSYIGKLILSCGIKNNVYELNNAKIDVVFNKLNALKQNYKFMNYLSDWMITTLNFSLGKYNIDFVNELYEYDDIITNTYLFTCYQLYSRFATIKLLETSIDKINVNYIVSDACKIRWYQKTLKKDNTVYNLETKMFFTLLNFFRIFNCKIILDYTNLKVLIKQKEMLIKKNIFGPMFGNTLKKSRNAMKTILYDVVRIIKYFLTSDSNFTLFYELVIQVMTKNPKGIDYNEIIADFLSYFRLFWIGNYDIRSRVIEFEQEINETIEARNDFHEDDQVMEDPEEPDSETETDTDSEEHCSCVNNTNNNENVNTIDESDISDSDEHLDYEDCEQINAHDATDDANNKDNIFSSLARFLECDMNDIKKHLPIFTTHCDNKVPDVLYEFLKRINNKEFAVSAIFQVQTIKTRFNLLSIEVVNINSETSKQILSQAISDCITIFNSLGDVMIFSNLELYRTIEEIMKDQFFAVTKYYDIKPITLWIEHLSGDNMIKNPKNKESMLKFLNKFGMYLTYINDSFIKSFNKSKNILRIASDIFHMFQTEIQMLTKLMSANNKELMNDPIVTDAFCCVANIILGYISRSEFDPFSWSQFNVEICRSKMHLYIQLIEFYNVLINHDNNNVAKFKTCQGKELNFDMFNKFLIDVSVLQAVLDYNINEKKFESLQMAVSQYDEESMEIEYDDLPDKFQDPLTCEPIKNPIMLPGVNNNFGNGEECMFFEKNNIVKHLLTKEENPYTREKLTIEDLDSYNKQSHVLRKINEFIEELVVWKASKNKIKEVEEIKENSISPMAGTEETLIIEETIIKESDVETNKKDKNKTKIKKTIKTKEKAAKEKATKEKATKEKATKEEATKEKATKEKATKEKATKEKATKEKATKEKLTKEKVSTKKAPKEEIAKKKIPKEKVSKTSNNKKSNAENDKVNKVTTRKKKSIE
jgi:hypothetical protein